MASEQGACTSCTQESGRHSLLLPWRRSLVGALMAGAGDAASIEKLRGRLAAPAVKFDRVKAERDAAQREAVTARQERDDLRDGVRSLRWTDHSDACPCVRCDTIRQVRDLFISRETGVNSSADGESA